MDCERPISRMELDTCGNTMVAYDELLCSSGETSNNGDEAATLKDQQTLECSQFSICKGSGIP